MCRSIEPDEASSSARPRQHSGSQPQLAGLVGKRRHRFGMGFSLLPLIRRAGAIMSRGSKPGTSHDRARRNTADRGRQRWRRMKDTGQ